jgi:hypothetical protein
MRGKSKALFALVAIAITAGALWFTNKSITPKEATWDDIVAEAERGDYQLIRTEELWERFKTKSKNLLLVDTRQGWEYRTGHIKSALNFPIEPTWLSESLDCVLLSRSGMSPQ